jgi:hypothetical protein
MRLTVEAGQWRLDAETAEEVDALDAVSARQTGRVTTREPKAVVLTWGVIVEPAWLTAVRDVGRVWAQAAPDWLAAGALVAASVAALTWLRAVLAPRLALGLALVLMTTAATLAGALSSLGVRPSAVSRRWWRWAYWVAGAWLALLAGAVTVGVLLWLAWTLAGVAQRIMP